MLDRFQNLPPVARTVIFLAFVAVVVGIVALLAHFGGGTQPTQAPITDAPLTTGSPAATPSASAPPTSPASQGPNNLAATDSPTDIYGKNRKYSDSQLVAATDVARKALLANCTYGASQTPTQWVASQRPYFTADALPSEDDRVALITSQSCKVLTAKPQSQTTDGKLIVGIAAAEQTVYQAGAPIVPDSDGGKTPYGYTAGGTVTLELSAGKWRVAELDVSQQGN